ncbi:MAG: NAD(P)H-dependent oxidoreductase subunit E [candidate division WOR-3 bacterium]
MEINKKEIIKIIDNYNAKRSALIAILQDIQEKFNWLPSDALKLVAEKLSIPLIDVYSVATFYRAFKLVRPGKHNITVCMGTACHVRGAPNVLERFEDRLNIKAGGTTLDYSISLETVNCLGCCALAPVVVVDGKYNAQTTLQKADKILEELKTKTKPVVKKAKIQKKKK